MKESDWMWNQINNSQNQRGSTVGLSVFLFYPLNRSEHEISLPVYSIDTDTDWRRTVTLTKDIDTIWRRTVTLTDKGQWHRLKKDSDTDWRRMETMTQLCVLALLGKIHWCVRHRHSISEKLTERFKTYEESNITLNDTRTLSKRPPELC